MVKGVFDTHRPLEFKHGYSFEGLIGRKSNRGGYYYLYEPERPTFNLIFLKKRGSNILLGFFCN